MWVLLLLPLVISLDNGLMRFLTLLLIEKPVQNPADGMDVLGHLPL